MRQSEIDRAIAQLEAERRGFERGIDIAIATLRAQTKQMKPKRIVAAAASKASA